MTIRALVLLLAGLLLTVAGCSGGLRSSAVRSAGPDSPPPRYAPGQLVLPGGAGADDQDFLRLASKADYILIGERHDNPLDHEVQAKLLELLAAEGRRPVLGLEMLPRKRYDRQLAAFSKGRTSLDELPSRLDWRQTWGFDFSLYAPIFAVAERYSLPVHGLNIPNEVRLGVSRNGLAAVSGREKRELPRSIIPPLPEQRRKLEEFFRMHSGMIAGRQAASDMPLKAQPGVVQASEDRPVPASNRGPAARRGDPFERFLLIQSLWDSTMAEQAYSLRRTYAPHKNGRPVVVAAGSGHVEHGYGIAHRLAILDPGSSVMTVMPFSGTGPEADAAAFFYYSPETDTPSTAQRGRIGLQLEPEAGKLRVTAVVPGSRAEKAGFKPGDVLERAGSLPVRSASDLHKAALDAKKRGLPLAVAIKRDSRFTALLIPGAP